MDLKVNNILAHINTVFVLRTKVDKYASSVTGFPATKSQSLSSSASSTTGGKGGASLVTEGSQDQRRPPSPTSEHSK